jgi:hypothetical protein
MSSSAAKGAAKTQADAALQAAQIQKQMYDQTRTDLSPYNTTGQAAAAKLANMPAYAAPAAYHAPGSYNPGTFSFQPTMAQLEATPGYQFAKSQGLESTQNSFAARGLGISGAAMKGAANFATGLADNTYQNQFGNAYNSFNANATTGQNAWNANAQAQQNAYSENAMLSQNAYATNLGAGQYLANLGENAAAQTGQIGATTAGNIGSAMVGAANASAAGQIGSANAISGGLSSVGNGIGNALLMNAFLNNGSYAATQMAGSALKSDAMSGAYTGAFL